MPVGPCTRQLAGESGALQRRATGAPGPHSRSDLPAVRGNGATAATTLWWRQQNPSPAARHNWYKELRWLRKTYQGPGGRGAEDRLK